MLGDYPGHEPRTLITPTFKYAWLSSILKKNDGSIVKIDELKIQADSLIWGVSEIRRNLRRLEAECVRLCRQTPFVAMTNSRTSASAYL